MIDVLMVATIVTAFALFALLVRGLGRVISNAGSDPDAGDPAADDAAGRDDTEPVLPAGRRT